MKWSNAVHNILNVLLVLPAALELFDWGVFFDAETALKVTGAFALAKIIINVTRDGFIGLVAEQPPVRSGDE
jgi:hypothetical protein